ncbi:MAG: transaldolase, partial [Chloroflexota bacterium]
MMNNVNALNELGQSIWLNYLRRAFVESGELNEYLAAGIAGVTSTPLIFEKAIIGSADYDRALAQSVKAGLPVKTIYEALVVDDCQRACDLLHPLFERSQGVDGYVSVELDPDLAHDEIGTVATARHLMTTVNRANAMLEIPATPAGLSALITLIGEGISVNVTHVFSLATYEAAARAYLAGIKNYLDVHSGWPFRPASVVSFSVSSVDSAVDTVLAAIGRPDLQGQTAIALAKVIYSRFRDLFSGPEWEAMLHRRAHPQRPKWTRTTPRNFAYPATFYVEALIGPNTVTTVAPAVFHAFGERDLVNSTLTTGLEEAHAHLATLAELGIDLEAIANQLQAESLANFHTYYQALMGSAARKRDQLDAGWQRMEVDLGPLQAEVNRALAGVAERRLMTRIWAYDPTVWRSGPETPRDRLNWLPAVEVMQEHAGRIQVFASSVLADRYTRAVCLEKGEASLVPQLFYQTFGKPARPSHSRYPYLELAVLDVNDPQAVLTESRRPDLDQTLFIVPGRVEEDSTGLYGFLD